MASTRSLLMVRIALAALAAGLVAGSVPAAAAPAAHRTAAAIPPDNRNSIYTLDGYGSLHWTSTDTGASPNLPLADYFGWDIARGFALFTDGKGGYMLDGFGGLHPIGTALPITGADYFGFDIARAIALAPWATTAQPDGWVLDGWGGIHPFGPDAASLRISIPGYLPGWDIARGIWIEPNSRYPGIPQGYTMDGFGGFHPFGGAPDLVADYFGFDIARGFSMARIGPGGALRGYMLDGWGGLHPLAGSPAPSAAPGYWPGWDIAHGLVLWTGNPNLTVVAGWTMDGFGGFHSFGGAPSLQGAYWNWDIARGIGGPGASGSAGGRKIPPAAPPPPPPPPVQHAVPTRLTIPKMGLDHVVIDTVGVDANGAMAVPPDPNHAGWFNGSPAPGDKGNSVIEGHKDWWDGQNKIFFTLGTLTAGDTVTIDEADGTVLNFTVDQSATYANNTLIGNLYTVPDRAQISLVTCSGAWAGTQYATRLVVHAVL